jgi:beta-galactosidase/beta-glucuronidase
VPEALHYATEIVWKQHAKPSRLRKPDNGKRTSGAWKETGQRRRKERKLLENGQRNWNKYINSKGVNGQETDTNRDKGPPR